MEKPIQLSPEDLSIGEKFRSRAAATSEANFEGWSEMAREKLDFPVERKWFFFLIICQFPLSISELSFRMLFEPFLLWMPWRVFIPPRWFTENFLF